MEEHNLKTELLKKYLEGAYTKDDLEKLYKILRDEKDNDIYINITSDLWAKIEEERRLSDINADAIFLKALQTAQFQGAPSKSFNWTKIAAVFIGLLFFCGFVLYFLFPTPQNVYSTKEGEQRIVILPDQSKVVLAGGSTLSYNKGWKEAKTREVFLEGEAFFEVTENKKKPFFVKTTEVQIKVLGTSFNVKAYKEDETVETTLVTGSINLTTNQKTDSGLSGLVMKPNERAVFNKAKRGLYINTTETDSYTAWKEKRLVFKDHTFAQVVASLERWYGVKIEAEEQNMNCPFTAKFDKESLKEVMDLISRTSTIKYEISGKTVTIKGKFCR